MFHVALDSFFFFSQREHDILKTHGISVKKENKGVSIMKKQLTVILLSIAIIVSALLSACSMDNMNQSLIPDENTPSPSTPTDYDTAIRQLEDRIIELQQAQYISDAEYQKELAALMQELTLLKNQTEADEDNSTPEDPDSQQKPNTQPPTAPLPVFLYTLTDNRATITG